MAEGEKDCQTVAVLEKIGYKGIDAYECEGQIQNDL